MGSQTDFFEATGPTTGGFRTNGTRISRGVNVTGTELGVSGSGSGPGSVGVEGHGGPDGIGVADFPSRNLDDRPDRLQGCRRIRYRR